MHRYIINIFNRRHIFSNVFITSLLISNHQPRFVSFRLPRIARDAYARRRENAAKVGNENASRPRNHVQIDVQILVARVSDSQTSSITTKRHMQECSCVDPQTLNRVINDDLLFVKKVTINYKFT